MEAADEGNERGLADGGVVEAEAGEGSEEVGMGEEGVGAVEDLEGFGVDFFADGAVGKLVLLCKAGPADRSVGIIERRGGEMQITTYRMAG